MKKKFVLTLLVFGSTWSVFSQRVSQKIGTNPTIIAPSAVVEIESTTKGFLPPRMTFVQRNAINSPATGLIVYCTDCGVNGELQVYNGTTWTNITGSSASARICRVPTNSGGFLVFKCHNLGADESADPLAPSWRLNGAYFQWGKKPVDTNGDNYRTKLANGPEGFAAAPYGPGASEANDGNVANWSTIIVANGSWNIDENTPVKTANDPCPSGFRVPTINEWMNIYNGVEFNWINIGTWDSSPTNYTSGKLVSNSLFLPSNGVIDENGSLVFRGYFGGYWSSTGYNSYGANSLLTMNTPFIISINQFTDKVRGMGVRCVAE